MELSLLQDVEPFGLVSIIIFQQAGRGQGIWKQAMNVQPVMVIPQTKVQIALRQEPSVMVAGIFSG